MARLVYLVGTLLLLLLGCIRSLAAVPCDFSASVRPSLGNQSLESCPFFQLDTIVNSIFNASYWNGTDTIIVPTPMVTANGSFGWCGTYFYPVFGFSKRVNFMAPLFTAWNWSCPFRGVNRRGFWQVVSNGVPIPGRVLVLSTMSVPCTVLIVPGILLRNSPMSFPCGIKEAIIAAPLPSASTILA